MYAKAIALIACAAFASMGCTTRPDPGRLEPVAKNIPPPDLQFDLPLENDSPRRILRAQACLLGTAKSCMDLDPRPFEPCLATARGCNEMGEGGIIPLGESLADFQPLQPR